MRWNFSPMGDTALLLEFDPADQANALALALAAALEDRPPPGLVTLVPAISSLLICFDPLQTDHAALEPLIRARLLALAQSEASSGRLVEIPVRYGGAAGPDLAELAETLGLSQQEIIRLHCAQPYRVMMIGFAPGFPYIGPVPPALHVPRRATPRTAVPPGSVAIAAGLTGIYPARLPGGWHLIGQTDLRLFDPLADPPAALAPGDWVQFVMLEDNGHD